jgi:MYXO-CTERM domain-containing protein
VEVTLRFNCDATNATLPNGSYLVSLLGRVGELAEFTSTETEFTVACPAPPPEPIDTAMTGPEPPAAGPAQAPTQGLSAASEEQREDVSAIQDCGVGTMPRRSNAAWALLFALGAALLLRRHNRLDP